MNQQGKARETKQGSVLVFSLLILSIMLVTSLTILSSALLNQKASLSTGSSTRSFQVADSGVEEVLYEIYKGNRATLSALATALGGSPAPSCLNGVVSFSVAGGSAKVSFHKNDPSTPGATVPFTDCSANDWRDQVVKIRSEGTAGSTTRAVEVAVAARCAAQSISDPLEISPGASVTGITFDSSTNSIWTTAFVSTNVGKYNVSTGQRIGGVSSGGFPTAIAFDSSTNSIWVTDQDHGSLLKFRASDMAFVQSYNTGVFHYIIFDSVNNVLWATGGSGVYKFSTNGVLIGSYNTGTNPMGIAFVPNGGNSSVWVANSMDNTVTKVRASDGVVLGTYATGGSYPFGVAYDSSTNSIWVTNYNSDTVTKFSINGTNIGSYPAGDTPAWVASDPVSNSIWITHVGLDYSIYRINPSTGSLLKTINLPLGTQFSASPMVTYDPVTQSIWTIGSDPSGFALIRIKISDC